MEWPRIDGHSRGAWYAFRVETDFWRVEFGRGHIAPLDRRRDGNSEYRAATEPDARLLALIGPHLCDVPDCPGPKLVARLEAADALAKAVGRVDTYARDIGGSQSICDGDYRNMMQALAAYEATK